MGEGFAMHDAPLPLPQARQRARDAVIQKSACSPPSDRQHRAFPATYQSELRKEVFNGRASERLLFHDR
jgi:hypothetical protein